jgi:hypothetical protein
VPFTDRRRASLPFTSDLTPFACAVASAEVYSNNAVLRHYAGEPSGAKFRRALLGLEVAINHAKSHIVTVLPLEVVHKRPEEITFEWDTISDTSVHLFQVISYVVPAVKI